MNWGFLKNVLRGVNKHSTFFRRLWLIVVFLLRILVYVAAAEKVWKDEQRDFVCNTEQPGCENACFKHSFPISQIHLWALQLIMVSAPSLLVACRKCREAKDKGSIDRGLYCTYILSLFITMGFEVGFLLAFYFLYNDFGVPIRLQCSQEPCPNTVDCYISKSTEKKVFLILMGCTSILCIVLNFLELICIMRKWLWKHCTVDQKILRSSELNVSPETDLHQLSTLKKHDLQLMRLKNLSLHFLSARNKSKYTVPKKNLFNLEK